VKYIVSASILAIAILIGALMPRYYLIFSESDRPVVQIGPFATQAACESARHRVPEAVLTSDPKTEKTRDLLFRFTVCVSSR
jgi:hypothetical protein